MKLVLLHGAPAVGKYTIGKELEKETGYKLVHIHSMYDFLEDIFGKEKYYEILKILNKLYLDIFDKAGENKIKGLIFTYTDIGKDKFSFIKQVLKTVKKHRGKMYFVHLSCNMVELSKRVVRPSRKKFKKTNNVRELNYLFSVHNYHETFSREKTLKIDNTNLSPNKVAKNIADFIKK